MHLKELKSLVEKGEGDLIEFKKKANYPDKIVREMVAFANSQGGYLFIGVDDNGNLSGLKHAEEEQYVLDKAIYDHCRPSIRFQKKIIKLNEKRSVLVYTVKESKNKPHYWIEHLGKKGNAYVRVEDRSVRASAEIVKILKAKRNNRGQLLTIGEDEKLLLSYVEEHKSITLHQLMEITQLSRNEASNLLVSMVNSNILAVQAGEQHDLFKVKQTHGSIF